MMETSGGEAWIVEFFPAIGLIPQVFPEMGGVLDTARPSAPYSIVSAVCLSRTVSAFLTHAHDGHRLMLITLYRSHSD